MTDQVVLYEVAQGVATIALNRPAQRNAINPAVCDAMRAAFDQVEGDPAVRCAVLTGAGTLFCAGMDLKAFAQGAGDTILFGQYGFGGFVKRKRSKPVIAAVEGAALAGGFEMMLACDMVIAGQSAQFALPEVRIGLIPGAGGAVRLPVSVPRVRANEILKMGAVGFDAVKHLVLCQGEKRPPRLNLDVYPYLPRARVETTSAASYMSLMPEAAECDPCPRQFLFILPMSGQYIACSTGGTRILVSMLKSIDPIGVAMGCMWGLNETRVLLLWPQPGF